MSDNNSKTKTIAITAAQGIQNPRTAENYGRDSSKGAPNLQLIKNLERYVRDNEGELRICAIPGSYVNEIELHPFFHKRTDVFMERNAQGRLEMQREREEEKRNNWVVHGKSPNMPMHFFWKDIPDTNYETTGDRLNTNVRLIAVPEPSQNQNPLTGKGKYTKKYGGSSIIMPSPKQVLTPVAKGQSGEYPKLMLTTGCCTNPSYNTTNRRGFDADEEHEFGFMVVDVLDDKLYLPRLVPAQANGTFIDQGIKYAKGVKSHKAKTVALVLGDSHVSELDLETDKANDEMILYFKPEHVHIHDAFSAQSINLHELDDEIAQADKFERRVRSLEEELDETGEYLIKKAKLTGKGEVVVNYSNHDDMLYRWLAKGHYRNDPQNKSIAHSILGKYGSPKENALEVAIRHMFGEKIPKNVRFLKLGEDAEYWGYQCGVHGHKGKNGARGSLKSLTEIYGKIIMGHVHQLEVGKGSMSVGTSSLIPLDYQLGQPSTSMAGNGVLYDGGLFQALPIIKGRWRK